RPSSQTAIAAANPLMTIVPPSLRSRFLSFFLFFSEAIFSRNFNSVFFSSFFLTIYFLALPFCFRETVSLISVLIREWTQTQRNAKHCLNGRPPCPRWARQRGRDCLLTFLLRTL